MPFNWMLLRDSWLVIMLGFVSQAVRHDWLPNGSWNTFASSRRRLKK